MVGVYSSPLDDDFEDKTPEHSVTRRDDPLDDEATTESSGAGITPHHHHHEHHRHHHHPSSRHRTRSHPSSATTAPPVPALPSAQAAPAASLASTSAQANAWAALFPSRHATATQAIGVGPRVCQPYIDHEKMALESTGVPDPIERERLFEQMIRSKGWELHRMLGDGNCMFRAFARLFHPV